MNAETELIVEPRARFTERRNWHRRMSQRMLSYVIVAILPTLFGTIYLGLFASNQYISNFGFVVRQAQPMKTENGSVGDSLGGGSSLLAAAMDSEIVVHYIKSHQILEDLRGKLDLKAIYARADADWLARLPADAPPEVELRYWNRVVDPYFDMTSGLVNVKVRAFDPGDAQAVATAVLELSERLINRMSDRAHADRLRFALDDVVQKERHLTDVEKLITAYRNTHGILYPTLHANENTSLDGQIREQIAQDTANMTTLLQQGISANSPQIIMLRHRISALQAQEATLRFQLTSRNGEADDKVALANALGGYEELQVQERLAEHSFDRAEQTEQQAASQAAQQQVYLATFVQPDRPVESLYPPRLKFILVLFIGCSALWGIGILIFYGIREHFE